MTPDNKSQFFSSEYIHSDVVDGDNKYGQVMGFPRRAFVGGRYSSSPDNNPSSYNGSRSTHFQFITIYAGVDISLKYKIYRQRLLSMKMLMDMDLVIWKECLIIQSMYIINK